MWRVLLLVFCYHVVSQPVTDEPFTRHTRELIECCPCPGSNHAGQGMLASQLRAVDDCPCRPRTADSEGASSMFFPTRTSAKPINSVPFLKSNDPNDLKNLLEPEVGLATSMLETLREATEEEYQDALARDAARSSDAVPEESARNVVIIVKPYDDEDAFVSEASNVKEARCINPVGSPLGKMKTKSPLMTLPDFFKLSKARQPNLEHRNLWDMDSNVGASNVQKSVVDIDGGTADSKPRSPLFKFRTPLKENPLKTPVFDKLEQNLKNRPNIFERFNLPLIPPIKVIHPLRKTNNNINNNSDLSPAPTDVKELIEKEDDKGIFKLNKRPLMLKNLLKLKDVELVTKTVPKLPIFKSKLNSKDLPTSLNRDADEKCEDSSYDSDMNEKVLLPKNLSIPDPDVMENIKSKNSPNQVSSLNTIAIKPKEEQDAITSPSEIIPNIMGSPTNIVESDETDCNDVSLEETSERVSNISEDDVSNETLDPEVESKIEDVTENEDSNASKDEAKEDSDAENEVSETNANSRDSIGNVISFHDTDDSILLPQVEVLTQNTMNPLDNENDFTSLRNVEDQTQNNDPSSEEISKKIIPNIKPLPPLSETLSAIKENVKTSLENLKKTTKDVIPGLTSENTKNRNLRTDTVNKDPTQEPQDDDLIEENSVSEVKENPDQVTFNDLQKLSDDLLDLSSNKDLNSKEVEDELKSDFESDEEQKQTEETEPDSFETESTTAIPEADIKTPKDKNTEATNKKGCSVDFDENKVRQKTMQLKSVLQDDDGKDMSVEASAPIANTSPSLLDPLNLNEQLGSSLFKNVDPLDPLNLNEKLGSSLLPNLDPLNLNEKLRSPVFTDRDPLNLNEKLASSIFPNLDPLNLNLGSSKIDPMNVRSLQDIIIQPTIPNDPLNILGKPIPEVFKLPTFEDLRQRLSSVFDPDDRSAENNFSDEYSDCTNVAPVEMAPAASTNNLRKVPSLRPLADMNVDIFQLNPMSQSDVLSNTPRLNLNNFRAKLPIPSNLDLKPVKLESRVGNKKGNVLGASLTFSNDKATSRKPKTNSNVLGSPLGNPLNNPLGNLPSLDELRNTFHTNTQNLLRTPPHSNLDLFRDSNLGASGIPDIDEIRRNAEKTMKGLQQRMKSTFKGGKISNPLSEFARPQDLLEDVNDKLKAIHYDLNDRLSSIHEDILDQTRIKPLAIPARPTIPINRNTNIMNNIRKTKGKPARLQTSASTISSQEIDPSENTNDNLFRSPARSSARRVQSNTHRTLLGSESSPVATKVELVEPHPKTTIDIPRKSSLPLLPRLPSLRQGTENLFPQHIRAKPLVLPRQSNFVKDLKRPILKKPSPFKDKTSKVTITFATTTASPATSPSDTRVTPTLKSEKTGFVTKSNSESLKEKWAPARTKTLGDAKQPASEFKPSVLVNPKNNFKTASTDFNLPQVQKLESIELTKPKFPSFKDAQDSKLRFNENNPKKLNSIWAFNNNSEAKSVEAVTEKPKAKPLVWPKSGEDSFLAKVREAMQARLNNFNPARAAEKDFPKIDSPYTDMIRAASENSDVVVQEPLKENVTYRCRMVCTKE